MGRLNIWLICSPPLTAPLSPSFFQILFGAEGRVVLVSGLDPTQFINKAPDDRGDQVQVCSLYWLFRNTVTGSGEEDLIHLQQLVYF